MTGTVEPHDPDPETATGEADRCAPLARRDYVFDVQESVRSIRLDRYLVGKFPNFSRTYLQKLIRDRAVSVNGTPTDRIRHPIEVGDRIAVRVPGATSLDLAGEYIPLDIVFEDSDLVAINKPAGLVVHPPGRGSNAGTLVSGLVYHFQQELSTVSGPLRPGIVHRLDKDTSGIMLVAKNDSAHFQLARQFHERAVRKVYQAVVQGELERDEDVIDLPIARHRRNPEKMAIDFRMGKSAQTQYKVLERFRGYTYVELYPRSGRTHQLRVHMTYIGHPVATDFLYGNQRVIFGDEFSAEPGAADRIVIARQALHAHRIRLEHPVTRAALDLAAPLAPDIEELLDNLQRHRRLR
ncbi:MAG: RluA family pseudouridine synthase [Planctomycetes bacterium]|nr:RluA family pseudouridine synthase [Planctomycetota bacterium]